MTSIIASKATATTQKPSSNGRNFVPTIKFSNGTERLQYINRIRKAPMGAQMKSVIDILLELEAAENKIYVDTLP
ncbi:hypothetical protein RJT34_07526 [Clitoria ternatea]|uniref:Uncharacterized protein n=1 Tax=Clitoria ternatea TaxID=43366 RepID=A0AAN9PU24_CLITE